MLMVRPIITIISGDIRKSPKGHSEIEMSDQIGDKKGKYYEFKDEEDEEDDNFDREEKKDSDETNNALKGKTKNQMNVDETSGIFKGKDIHQIQDGEWNHEAMNNLKSVLKKEVHGHSLEELFVHQLIETIEFVLGTVSNTASYLRLWALSLAHSQLAEVFYEKTLVMGLEMNSSIVLFISQQLFWAATLGVLMSMDSMECFLHTLRLHWVEFQNKFYKGTGSKFIPLSFRKVVIQED